MSGEQELAVRGGGSDAVRRRNYPGQGQAAKQALAVIAGQTQGALQYILKDLPNLKPEESELLTLDGELPPLKSQDCPKHPKTPIKVFNDDTFDTATAMMNKDDPHSTHNRPSRPAVLNLASDTSPGGGWLKGCMAQEEALCYRSSLSLSLHKPYYPLRALQGIYTRDVVIIRSSVKNGHKLIDVKEPADQQPVVSVVSVAALRRPAVSEGKVLGSGAKTKAFAKKDDRALTKKKMALVLRIAASRGHDRLVLGALGCGAFANPVDEIVDCWKEVFEEHEFSGGWWKDVWFAVLDRNNVGTFRAFEKTLGGLEV